MGGQETAGKGRQGEADVLLAALASAEAITDPYPLYARLRALAPAHRAPSGAVFVTRYQDCAAITRDPAFHAQSPGWCDRVIPGWRDRPARAAVTEAMQFRDPPDHTRLRRLVSASFTPRQVSNMREDIERLTGRALNLIADGGSAGSTVDLREVLASSLPVSVMGTLVGVPPADWVPLQALMQALLEVVELSTGPRGLATPQRTTHGLAGPDQFGADQFGADQFGADQFGADQFGADQAAAGLREYFAGLVAECRRTPRDDLTTALVAARTALTEDEVVRTLTFVFMAGTDTMINLLTNGTAALLAHPEQADALRDDPRLQTGAVDEVLRYDSPVQFVGRVASADTTIGGVPVLRDGLVIAMLGAANRDPARFPAPESFDIRRTGTTVLSFGGGIHYCAGALLARLEAGTFLPALLERFPALRLAGPPRRRGLVYRGFSHLPVAAQ
jgi:cytochrome P450